MNIVIYSCAYVWRSKRRRRSRILVCVFEEENQTMTTCSNAVPTLHRWMHTHHIRILYVCVWALWLLTRERVFWLMMIHEINFNSYDQRLFAFEMKAFSHRFAFDPLYTSAMAVEEYVERKIILVLSLINTCFVTALIHSLTKSEIRSRIRIGIGIEHSLSSVTKQSCIMSLALHHPPGQTLKAVE